jgi:hypothetical protein
MPLPLSASSALKMQSPRKMYAYNRLLSTRDASPVPDYRARSNSVKRKEPEGPSFAEITAGSGTSFLTPAVATGRVDPNVASDLTLEIAKVSSLVNKAATDINDHVKDPVIVSVFSSVFDAVRGIIAVQDKIVTCGLTGNADPVPVPAPGTHIPDTASGMVNLGAIPKKPRNEPRVNSHKPVRPGSSWTRSRIRIRSRLNSMKPSRKPQRLC